MASQPIFRFAPSPNGWLHLGHAFSALLTFEAAKAAGGTFLLRIEDIDKTRCRPEFDRGIIEDLQWLGLSWPEPVWRQSTRFAAYSEAAERLTAMNLLYPCFCSRGDIAARARGTDPDGAPLYDRRCHDAAVEIVVKKLSEGVPHHWRLNMDAARTRTGPLRIRECPVEGHEVRCDAPEIRAADPGRWGDVVLVRKDTPTSYHLSVVVDDAAQGVTHVTRGMDLHAATDVHVLLQALLGLPAPIYAHHGLIRDADDQKLAKSKGAPSLRSLREAGWTAAEVRRKLGF